MNTYLLRRGKPRMAAVTALQSVACRAITADVWWMAPSDTVQVPCPHEAAFIVDGVACCGKHRRQIEMCKRSRRRALPRWFVEAAVTSPQEAELLLGKEPKVKRTWIRRRSKRMAFVTPALATHMKEKK